MKKISDITKLKIVKIFFNNAFWIPIAIAYFKLHNLSETQAFSLIGFFSLATVLAEYPTGVIGDYISHKFSTILGYFITAGAMILIGLNIFDNFFYYLVLLVIAAIGASLVSGSDDALLYSISKDFKKDFSSLKSLTIISMGISVSVGSLIAEKTNLVVPIYLTAGFYLAAGIISLFIKNPHHRTERKRDLLKNAFKPGANVFSKSKEGFEYLKKNRKLLILLIFTGILTGILFDLKWLSSVFFDEIGVNTKYWGLLLAISMLVTAIGVKLSNYSKINYLISLFILSLTFALTGFTKFIFIAVIGFFLLHIYKGITTTQLDILINDELNDSIRASILSLKNLILKFSQGLYTFFIGFAIDRLSIFYSMFLTAVFVFLCIIALMTFLTKNEKLNN